MERRGAAPGTAPPGFGTLCLEANTMRYKKRTYMETAPQGTLKAIDIAYQYVTNCIFENIQ